MNNEAQNKPISWKRIIFGSGEKRTKQEKILVYKIFLILILLGLVLWMIFPIDKMFFESEVKEETGDNYSLYSLFGKIVLFVFFSLIARERWKDISELYATIKKDDSEIENNPDFKAFSEMNSSPRIEGKDLGFKGIILAFILSAALCYIIYLIFHFFIF